MHETRLLVFRDALAALDAGDTGRLEQQLRDHEWLGRYSCRVGELYEHGYFAGARLLWHVAGNPDRGPLPPNIVAVTRVLAGYAAWPEDVEQTVGLILTSRRASEAGVAMQLIDVLKSDGSFDVARPGLLDKPLLNAAPGTAVALIERGATLLAPGGQSPRTALHEGANRGHSYMVRMLLDAGANASVLDSRWQGTPAGWADEGGHPDIATMLRLRENDRH